jgi:hypothetical protein
MLAHRDRIGTPRREERGEADDAGIDDVIAEPPRRTCLRSVW